jgi:hypothetical protein
VRVVRGALGWFFAADRLADKQDNAQPYQAF